jgi:CheY-like chemotaxis protein
MPVVALTAHAMAEDVERSRQAGCDAHCVKPIDAAALVETVREAVERARARPAPHAAHAA